PYNNNPRINDHAVDAVAASIREFGWKQPIVLDEDGVIVIGDTRYKAAIKNGDTKVPCVVASDISPEKIKVSLPTRRDQRQPTPKAVVCRGECRVLPERNAA
ncbi:MAG: ParB N-terminal domain-containing protein, partial [Betaproteobacteria bacterium]|nr:ParB N-terminal domain-containing protein [Betaproteobacteria bacterium]